MGLIDNKINTPITVISNLDTRPTPALTASQFKAKFDEGPEAIRVKHNGLVDDVISKFGTQDTINADIESRTSASETDISNIKLKTNNITVTQSVNLDTMESQIATNESEIANTYTKSEVDEIANNFTLGAVSDGSLTDDKMSNSAGQIKDRVAGIKTKTDNITVTQAVNLDAMESDIGTLQGQISNAGGKTDQYYTTSSTTGNIGAFVCDGVDDYGTLPASVGQLTNGVTPFVLIIPYKANALGTSRLLCKRNTAYSATSLPKGWEIIPGSTSTTLIATGTDGVAESSIVHGSGIPVGNVGFVKLGFDGTTVSLSVSNDGINFSTPTTSTTANLISGLAISDNVLTQIGRSWAGNIGYAYYFNGTIYSIQLTKSGTLTNRYEFKNFGTNLAVNDTVGTSHGTSAGGAIQGVSGTNYTKNTGGKYTALTDNMRYMMEADSTAGTTIQPTLSLDSLPTKPLIGTNIIAKRLYDVRYVSAIDSYVATTQEEKLVGQPFVLPSAASSFTIPNLDIIRDGGVYEIVVSNLVMSVSNALMMYINNDTTDTNYFTYYASAANLPYVSGAYTNTCRSNISLALSGNKALAFSDYVLYDPVSVGGERRYWEHKNTQTNITSITLKAPTGTINTATVKIYKK